MSIRGCFLLFAVALQGHDVKSFAVVNRSDPFQQSLKRLSNRLLELGAWRDRDWNLISDGEFRVRPDAAWQPVRLGDPWPIQDAPVEFRFNVVIPKTWAGSAVLGGHSLRSCSPHRSHSSCCFFRLRVPTSLLHTNPRHKTATFRWHLRHCFILLMRMDTSTCARLCATGSTPQIFPELKATTKIAARLLQCGSSCAMRPSTTGKR